MQTTIAKLITTLEHHLVCDSLSAHSSPIKLHGVGEDEVALAVQLPAGGFGGGGLPGPQLPVPHGLQVSVGEQVQGDSVARLQGDILSSA